MLPASFYDWLAKHSPTIARWSLFLVYFWFGILKVFNLSPAEELVTALQHQTIPFIPSDFFLVAFGFFECLIGVLFLVKGAEKIVFPLFIIHIITTTLPLFLLPSFTWQYWLVPPLTGQYIIKNIVLVAVAIYVVRDWRSSNNAAIG